MIRIHTVASGPKILCQYVVDLRYFTSGQKKYYFTTVDKKVIRDKKVKAEKFGGELVSINSGCRIKFGGATHRPKYSTGP